MVPYSLVAWYRPSVFWKLPPQLWRIATCMMITGPQLSILFDTYFLYMYLSQMDLGHPRFPRREDLVWYLIFVTSVIIVGPFFHSLRATSLFLLSWNLPAAFKQEPRISARTVYTHCCCGSWRRGRLPLHLGQSIIRKSSEGWLRCGHGGSFIDGSCNLPRLLEWF